MSEDKKHLCFFLAATLGVVNAAVYKTHTVSTGESLSQILYNYNLKPIYSKDGSLKNTVLANYELLKRNGNLIFSGQRIDLYKAGIDKIEEIPVRSELSSADKDSSESAQTEVKKKDDDYNSLTVSFLSGYLGVFGEDQNGETGEALSKLYFGVGGKWKTKFSKSYGLIFSLDYIDLEIEDTTSATLSDRDQSIKRIGIAINRDSSWINLELGYNLKDQILYRTASSNNFKVTTMINNQIYLQGERGIYEFGNALVSLGVNANHNSFNAPDGVDVSNGSGFGAYIRYQKQKARKSMAATLGYEVSSFKSSDTDMDYKVLSLRFDYEFDFLKENK